MYVHACTCMHMYRVAASLGALEISSSLFSLRSGHPDFICRIQWEEGALQIRVKNNTFRAHFDQQLPSGVKCIPNQHIFPYRTLPHMTDLMTYPHFHQITGVFKPSHNMARSAEERFAMERMATRGVGAKKIAAALGVPEATTKRWLRRLHSDGDVASRKHRTTAWCGGWCVSCVLCMSRLISLELCVQWVWW